ncbi:uncharacterized protein [Hemitrygon akajei]|uniref:uncharacterized protein n=1 Tax=Hemitrygon akajei TaxID=2704970 RepID=UPI003BF9F239
MREYSTTFETTEQSTTSSPSTTDFTSSVAGSTTLETTEQGTTSSPSTTDFTSSVAGSTTFETTEQGTTSRPDTVDFTSSVADSTTFETTEQSTTFSPSLTEFTSSVTDSTTFETTLESTSIEQNTTLNPSATELTSTVADSTTFETTFKSTSTEQSTTLNPSTSELTSTVAASTTSETTLESTSTKQSTTLSHSTTELTSTVAALTTSEAILESTSTEQSTTLRPSTTVSASSVAAISTSEAKGENTSTARSTTLTPSTIASTSTVADVDECLDSNICSWKSNSYCVNTVGSYNCTCQNGYAGLNCTDVNECVESNICSWKSNSYCVNTEGSFICKCLSGYEGDNCTDVDECLDWTICSWKSNSYCVNTEGSFNCTCLSGYAGDNCTDVNECVESNICSWKSNSYCVNTEGSFNCKCLSGYEGDNCTDVDECLDSNICSWKSNSYCVNTVGSYNCTCRNGYAGLNCTDVNECVESNICSWKSNSYCVNTEGSFNCECLSGYEGDNCTDVDECLDSNICSWKSNSYCVNTVGSYNCTCRNGYAGLNCTDVNECVESNICSWKSNSYCVNTEGSFNCKCLSGYEGDNCTDVDECLDWTICSWKSNSYCVNTEGSFNCTCLSGYAGDNCTDVNECVESNICSWKSNSYCVNTEGSFNCKCLSGYEGDNCTDVDECLDWTICSWKSNSYCVNTEGSFNCTCLSGYGGDNCTDVDECLDSNICSSKSNSRCVNTEGSFNCMCLAGYTGPSCTAVRTCDLSCTNAECFFEYVNEPACQCKQGFEITELMTVCGDINECETSNKCGQICKNTLGSYECSCRPGYLLNQGDKKNCSDIDECANPELNDCEHICQNTPGKYKCACHAGYKLDNEDKKNCIDIDECLSNPCNRKGHCTNTLGSFNCTCVNGFTGRLCSEDINECLSNPCMNGTCLNIPGSYKCRCYRGFTGQFCETDIDECHSQPCKNGATCMDLINNFYCTCRPGYTGQFCQKVINNCASKPCQNTGFCVNHINNYTCICPRNWEGRDCSTDVDECLLKTDNCDRRGGTCTNKMGSFMCSCKEGYEGDGIICREKRLFKYGTQYGDRRISGLARDLNSPTINIPTGFPFDDTFYYRLYFSDNGLITFQRNSYIQYIYSTPFWAFTRFYYRPPSMIAVFWDDADMRRGMGNIYYQSFDFQERRNAHSQNFQKDLGDQINELYGSEIGITFQPKWALRITWENMLPFTGYRNVDLQGTNTYQAVLLTDGIFSFCLIKFKDGGMNWKFSARPALRNYALMGYYSETTSSSFNDPQTRFFVPPEKIYRPDKYPGQKTGKNGQWAYRLEKNDINTRNPRQKCVDWYLSEPFPYWSFYTSPCPCSFWQALFDNSFTWGRNIKSYGFEVKETQDRFWTFQSRFPNWLGSGVRCYYSFTGGLIYGEKERFLPAPWTGFNFWAWIWRGYYYYLWQINYYYNVYLPREQRTYSENEVDPYNDCCRDSGDYYFCWLYRSRRPLDYCFGYIPPRIGFFFGDPHVVSLDGVKYTFNGLGEFTLLNVRDENDTVVFRLQGRTIRAGENRTSDATNFIALAAEGPNGTKVQWNLINDDEIILRVDGNIIDVTDNSSYINQVTVQITDNNETQASFEGGTSITVSGKRGALSFTTALDNSFKNKTEGLLGVWNDDKTDDFKAADGQYLEFDGTNLPNDSQIFFDFGLTWKITENNSVFTYNTTEGESWYTYNNNSFVPKFYDELLQTIDKEKIDKANETCKGNDDCIFDVLSTDDFAFGASTLQSVTSFAAQNSTMNNFPPNITGDSSIQTRLGEPVFVLYTAVDANDDPVTFSVLTNSSDITMTESGNFSWHPTSSSPVFAIIQANDSKATSELGLTLTICNCSINSTCDYTRSIISMQNNNAMFVVAACNCTPAYIGDYCTEDFDACEDNPCFVNDTCKDQPAPLEGHTCGPCPDNLQGDGEKCYDLDECQENTDTCEQICTNTFGSYNCSCEVGYAVNATNSSMCDDIDECSGPSACPKNADCINTMGNYTCVCKSGYDGKPYEFCVDVDECIESTDCSGNNFICTNTEGSFNCMCRTGYGGPNCTDIDECEQGQNNCPLNSKCNNTEGSYVCNCNSGYEGPNCTDINECTTFLDNCDNNADCQNTPGSFNCSCMSGMKGNGTFCEDIDECSSQAGNCSAGQRCENSFGSYTCICSEGYKRVNGTCEDIDECQDMTSCPENGQKCVNTEPRFTCECGSGFQSINGTCKDINECQNAEANNCSKSQGLCANLEGSYTCQCIAGYTGNGFTCSDIDECLDNNTCSMKNNSYCVNTDGSFNCTCLSGYEGPTCTDVNECLDINICSWKNNSYCVNTKGFYNCTCLTGYAGHNCTDIDECLDNNTCSMKNNSYCVNTDGSFKCTCLSGYEGPTCTDVNECLDSNICSWKNNSYCVNTKGFYNCTCLTGYAGHNCTDIDECLDNNTCSMKNNSYCVNTDGSFNCTCLSGYEGPTCTDVNECLDSNICSWKNNSYCVNTKGFYNCTCLTGYAGHNCTDIDECLDNNTCSMKNNSYCVNTDGSFNCTCLSGYEGPTCTDVNECLDSNICSWKNNSYCVNTKGFYNCTCLTGYAGHNCTDIDECLDNNTCSMKNNSYCVNTDGSFNCTCLSGYEGPTCTELPSTTSATASPSSTTLNQTSSSANGSILTSTVTSVPKSDSTIASEPANITTTTSEPTGTTTTTSEPTGTTTTTSEPTTNSAIASKPTNITTTTSEPTGTTTTISELTSTTTTTSEPTANSAIASKPTNITTTTSEPTGTTTTTSELTSTTTTTSEPTTNSAIASKPTNITTTTSEPTGTTTTTSEPTGTTTTTSEPTTNSAIASKPTNITTTTSEPTGTTTTTSEPTANSAIASKPTNITTTTSEPTGTTTTTSETTGTTTTTSEPTANSAIASKPTNITTTTSEPTGTTTTTSELTSTTTTTSEPTTNSAIASKPTNITTTTSEPTGTTTTTSEPTANSAIASKPTNITTTTSEPTGTTTTTSELTSTTTTTSEPTANSAIASKPTNITRTTSEPTGTTTTTSETTGTTTTTSEPTANSAIASKPTNITTTTSEPTGTTTTTSELTSTTTTTSEPTTNSAIASKPTNITTTTSELTSTTTTTSEPTGTTTTTSKPTTTTTSTTTMSTTSEKTGTMTTASKPTSIDTTTSKPTSSSTTTSKLTSSTTTTSKPTSTTKTTSKPTTTTTTSTTTMSTTAQPIQSDGHVILFPYGDQVGDKRLKGSLSAERATKINNFISPTFEPRMFFTFGETMLPSVYFTEDGLIVFPLPNSVKYNYANPFQNGFQSNSQPPMIAVFWINAYLSHGEVFYQEYETFGSSSPNLVQGVEKIIENNFTITYKARWTLKITWVNVAADPSSPVDESNTFQAVITTDGTYSFVLMLYEFGGMNWNVSKLPSKNVVIGYNSGSGFFKNDEQMNLPDSEKFRPDQRKGANADLQGLWIYQLNQDNLLINYRAKCLQWFHLEPPPSQWNEGLSACPCTFPQGQRDRQFQFFKSGTSNKILRRVNRNKFNASQRCIYRKNGAFIEGWQERYWIPTIQSPLLSKNKQFDLDPYTWCCEEVDDPKFCDYYKEKRPSITCEEYRPPGQGLGNGDPHFFTLDELPFTFNGLGDFVLLNINEPRDTTMFQLHARTVQTGEAQATNFAAFAARHRSTKTITVQMTLKGNDIIDVQLNEDNVQFTPTEGNKEVFYEDNFYLEKKGNSSVLAVFENGISLNVTAEFEMLNIVPSLPKKYMNKTQGLLGLWNNNQNDDFTMPNGSIIPANSSESTLYRYGLTWEVPSDQSIFTTQSVIARTANNMFTPVFLDELRQQNITLYNEGVAACNNNTQCIYDVVSTGKIEIGLSTAKTITQFNEDMQRLNSFPPIIEGNSVISTNLFEQVISHYTVKQHGNVVFNPYISKDLNITANGTLIWLPTNRNGLTVDVEAVDSNNLTSVLRPQLVLCDCGENGECNFNDTTRINRSSVYIAACICKDGFNGLSCRSSVDICQTLTCFTGVNCSSTACGSCPAGLNGDGIQCLDIDECKDNNSCSPNATCINTVRSYNCICKEGFSGNGTYCSDITECSTCSPNAVCKEIEGKFKCICNERFTGNGTTCTPLPGPCDSSQCPPTFCRNGGTCSLNPSLNCIPVCQCPSPYTGEQCTLVSLVFLAAQSPDLPKRVVNITLTLTNVNETSEINSTLTESIKEKVLEKANKVQQFNHISELRYWKRGGNVVASSQYFFNYNGNRTIIDFLNENLHSAILAAFNNAERAATSVSEFAPLNTSDIQDVSRLTYSQLLSFFNCNNTIFSGYVLQWDEQHGVVCRSPCDMDYCFNQAECQHQPTGPTCKCIPRTIYDSFGDRCEHLAMNLRAFFGILFGALAFLLLLMLAIFLIVWKCNSSGRSRFSNDSDSITYGNRQIFSWQSNPFSSKMKDTAILPSLDEKNLSPITWKPHLDNVNPATEIKIERPSLKRIGSDSEIP